jgi:hypothetical protein
MDLTRNATPTMKRRRQPDATSSKEPRTASSLHPCGGGGAVVARRVRRKVAKRRRRSERIWTSTSTKASKVFCQWSTRLVSAGACVCKQQTTHKKIGGRWCGSRPGAAALQVCRQCTHRSSQVNKGFFLGEQRCSVDQALASHVRVKRKFNP